MKFLFFTSCFVLCSVVSFGQTDSLAIFIKGIITNNDKEPVTQATIQVGEQYSQTNDKGVFNITVHKEGRSTIAVSAVGYENFSQTFSLKKVEIKVLDIVLSRSDDMLQNVEIMGRKETGYQNTHTFLGSKTGSADKDIPQSMAFVTKELMLDQGEVRVGDLVKNMPGVGQFSSYDDIVIRGFRINGGTSNTQLFNGLRTITGYWKQSITTYLERIEVLKGPASALYGNASPGGVLNRVTKKPLTEKRYSINFSTGSFNTIRANADLTGPANPAKTILYRINLGYENAQSFRDLQFDKGFIIAPSLSFLPTPKTRINLDLVLNQSNSRLDRGQAVLPGEEGIHSVPINRSLSMVNV